MSSATVVIAGGGTGGHVVPGLAIADALVAAGVQASAIHWVGSQRGMEVDAVPAAGYRLTALPGRGIERRLTPANIANVAGLVRGVVTGVRLIRRERPAVVVSLGGYAAVPCAVGAVLWRRPLVIQEQNATPSLANRMVARFARWASVPVAGTGLSRERVTGNPLSDKAMAALDLDRTTARAELGIDDERFVVLAFGGSLGARRINHAVLDLAEEWRDRDDVAIRHVIGRRDWPDLTDRVAALADEPLAYEAVEFEDRLPTALVAADVAVCRAGGMTIAELTALGVPAVLVPLPIAPNDAQRANAAAMSAAGAAVVVDDEALDHHLLAEHLETWRAGGLDDAAASARELGRPGASADIANAIIEEAGLSVDGPHLSHRQDRS